MDAVDPRDPAAVAEVLRVRAAERWGEAASAGYRAPRVLEVLGVDDGFGLPAQVMERAPGTTMLDALTARPWRAFALVDHLARLQLELHAIALGPLAGHEGPQGARGPAAVAAPPHRDGVG